MIPKPPRKNNGKNPELSWADSGLKKYDDSMEHFEEILYGQSESIARQNKRRDVTDQDVERAYQIAAPSPEGKSQITAYMVFGKLTFLIGAGTFGAGIKMFFEENQNWHAIAYLEIIGVLLIFAGILLETKN